MNNYAVNAFIRLPLLSQKFKMSSLSPKPVYPHIEPEISNWPIYQLAQHREEFVAKLVEETYANFKDYSKEELEELLNQSVYQEIKRTKENPFKVDPRYEQKYFLKLRKRLSEIPNEENPEKELRDILHRLVHRYAEEISGNFKIKTFKFARTFLTWIFKRLLLRGPVNSGNLYDKLSVKGPLEKVRHLGKSHTLVFVPTHFSNLDSILIGYAIDKVMGLPAFLYGAGLNLYELELVAYFMNRLGAYKVDRRKKNAIYISTLKKLSQLALESGVHSLFFPGGTRSRSGKIEDSLKLGLLSTVVEAQRNLFRRNDSKKLIIVPLNIGYHSVLEGKQMITQYLKHTGQEHYFEGKDGSATYINIIKFLGMLNSTGSEIFLTLGEPMDVFGYSLDDEGRSVDKFGNVIEVKENFMIENSINKNPQREQVYTKMLGNNITKAYRKHNTILSSHLVAYAAFSWIWQIFPKDDVFSIVAKDEQKIEIPYYLFLERVEDFRIILKKMESKGKLYLSDRFDLDVEEFVLLGFKFLGAYHRNKPLKVRSEYVVSDDLALLHYYYNRLAVYELDQKLINYRKKREKEKVKI